MKVLIQDDLVLEPNEVFNVHLRGPSHLYHVIEMRQTEAVVHIVDDDGELNAHVYEFP